MNNELNIKAETIVRDKAFYDTPLADEKDGPVDFWEMRKKYPDVRGFSVCEGKWYASRPGEMRKVTQEEIDEENRRWEEYPEEEEDDYDYGRVFEENA